MGASDTGASLQGDYVRQPGRPWLRFTGPTPLIMLAIIPAAIYYLTWLILPLVYSFVMSLFKWTHMSISPVGQEFVGLTNYARALNDPIFWTAMFNTVAFTVMTVVPCTALALALAVLINSLPRFQAFFRAAYFIPYVTSLVALSVMWLWLYQPQFGLINAVVQGLGGPRLRWLDDPRLALPSIAVVVIYQQLGYSLILFLAGLQGIPSEYYEAARIDGAGAWHLFRRITVPLLRPATLLVLVTSSVIALQVFDPIFVMTGSGTASIPGGPVNATLSAVLYMYLKGFREYQFGYASTVAFLLFVIVLAFSLVQFKLVRTTWEY